MKKFLVTLTGLSFSVAVGAQDFLQQWHDSATKGMNEFRSAHKAGIEASGWHFVAGTQSAQEIPISDVFVKDVKAGKEPVRSAYVLNVFYVAVPAGSLPEYRSTKALVWFNCREGAYEQRSLERYASADGRGDIISADTESSGSVPIELPGADPHSIEKPLLAAVCSAKL